MIFHEKTSFILSSNHKKQYKWFERQNNNKFIKKILSMLIRFY